jgi:hypothetical protein
VTPAAQSRPFPRLAIEPLIRLDVHAARARSNAMDASRPEATDQPAAVQAKEISETGPQKVFAEMEHKAKPKIEIDAERIRTSIARLTSNSIGELEGLASELQKLDEFIKFETERIQHDMDSLLSGIKIIVETISPWKRSATVSGAPTGPARGILTSGRGRDDMRRPPVNS